MAKASIVNTCYSIISHVLTYLKYGTNCFIHTRTKEKNFSLILQANESNHKNELHYSIMYMMFCVVVVFL